MALGNYLFIYLFFKKCPHKYSYARNTQTPRRKIHPMCRQHEIQLPILNSVTSTDRYHNSNNTSKYILIVREPREETGMKATVLYLCDLCSTKVKISLLRYSHSSHELSVLALSRSSQLTCKFIHSLVFYSVL